MLCPVSPLDTEEEEAADLFGPDEWGNEGGGHEPAVASGDVVDGGEVRMDSAADVGIEESTAQTPMGVTSPATSGAIELALH